MESFISKTLSEIFKTTQSFNNVVFILPSQRAGVFVKEEIKNHILTGFIPQIFTIEEFVSEVSKIKKIDSIQVLFYFYTVYISDKTKPESFDAFSSWAFTVLQDFNEIDQHGIPAHEIFVYLKDIHRLRKWSAKGSVTETDLIKDHFAFIEKLEGYYKKLYQFLVDKQIGYQGVLYREATQKIATFIAENSNKKFFFIGFNALNASEEFIFKKMLQTGNTDVYWDIDNAFLKSNHQAGKFIRKYKNEWKYYEKNQLKTIGNWFSNKKNIQIIGASKNITQIKYVGEILQKLQNHHKTALILADESLLPITLNSLPKNVTALNITMGYPLKDIPTTSVLFSVFKLFLTQEKLKKTLAHEFYYKDVIGFLKEGTIYRLIPKISEKIIAEIRNNNITFVNTTLIKSFFKTTDEAHQVIKKVFYPFYDIQDFLDRIIELLELLKEDTTALEKEYIYRFYKIFTELKKLHVENNYIQNLKTLSRFFRQLIASETLSFQGEPLQGLQLMGMLETRALDFETVIITSANEGILPANSKQSSFIPFDVKLAFNLPTYREKDAIFSYHFFRLLQRTKHVFILYNTENDTFGNGEKSRFVTQLTMLKEDAVKKIISPLVSTTLIDKKEILKSELTLNRLKEIAKKGISPSALTSYLYNPLVFYKQKILKIKEFNDVEETVASNTMGTVVHKVLEDLYTPLIGQYLTEMDISNMLKKVDNLTLKYFKVWFKGGTITTGKNKLIFEVAKRFIQNFLAQEKKLVEDKENQLKIIATEKKYTFQIKVDGIAFPIKLHGEVDRVDELNGVTRIIDYKTGMVQSSELKITDFEQLNDYKYAKAIQVLLYSFLYTKTQNYNFNKPIEAGVFSFKNLKEGYLKLNFSANYKAPENAITEEKIAIFMVQLQKLIKEIYNTDNSFIEKV